MVEIVLSARIPAQTADLVRAFPEARTLHFRHEPARPRRPTEGADRTVFQGSFGVALLAREHDPHMPEDGREFSGKGRE
jgi:hypothetical protein